MAADFASCITGAQNGPCPAPLNEANLIARLKAEINATGATNGNKHLWDFATNAVDEYNSQTMTCAKAANPPSGVVADATKCHPGTSVYGPIKGVTFDHYVGGTGTGTDYPAFYSIPKFTWADNITANKPGFIAALVLSDPSYAPGAAQDFLSVPQFSTTTTYNTPGNLVGVSLEQDLAGCTWGGAPPAHYFGGQAVNAINIGSGSVPIGGPVENKGCDGAANPLDSNVHLLVVNVGTSTSPATFQVDGGTPINLPPQPVGAGGWGPDSYLVTPGSTWITGNATISSPNLGFGALPLGVHPIGPNAAVIAVFHATGGVTGLDTAAQARSLDCVRHGNC